MALWLLWLLWISRARAPEHRGFQPPRGIGFVTFSAVCLAFAMYHSYTFLKLAGVIIHLKVFDKPVPPGVIVFTMFGSGPWSIVIMAC